MDVDLFESLEAFFGFATIFRKNQLDEWESLVKLNGKGLVSIGHFASELNKIYKSVNVFIYYNGITFTIYLEFTMLKFLSLL